MDDGARASARLAARYLRAPGDTRQSLSVIDIGAFEDDEVREERKHPDTRIARRAETISRLAAVARERGEVSEGLRRVLVVQAVRLAFIAAERLAFSRPDAATPTTDITHPENA